MDESRLAVIIGPTAAGKSAVALWLAERHGASIVSADSRQVYAGFDIGTAKPTADERRRVPHFGVDVLDPARRYSAAAWAADADRRLTGIAARGRTALVVGGTGLYLRALFGPLFDEPQMDPERRAALADLFATTPVAELRRWCRRLDPARAHLGRTQLLRAIEVALLTGRRVSALHRERARTPRWRGRYLLVDPGPVLADRIAARVDDMLARGWLDEVVRLRARVPVGAPAWNATGYGVLQAVAAGSELLERAREQVIVQTRRYAKRQRTWFRHQLEGESVTTLDPTRHDWRAVAEAWWAGEREA